MEQPVLVVPPELIEALDSRVVERIPSPLACEPGVGVAEVAAHLGCRPQRVYDPVSGRDERHPAPQGGRLASVPPLADRSLDRERPRERLLMATAHLRVVSAHHEEHEMPKQHPKNENTKVPGVYRRGNRYVYCYRTTGEFVQPNSATGSNIWDKLTDGTYVTDVYVNTPGVGGAFSAPVPQC